MTIAFGYEKKQVIQGLRYHFLSRPEIKILVILINVFALGSAVLFYFKQIQAVSFLIFSLLWFLLMLVIWRILPTSIYKKSKTFKDSFVMKLQDDGVVLSTGFGDRKWPWDAIQFYVETPYFFHLYFDARSFFLLPKDTAQTESSIPEIRAMISSKVKKGK